MGHTVTASIASGCLFMIIEATHHRNGAAHTHTHTHENFDALAMCSAATVTPQMCQFTFMALLAFPSRRTREGKKNSSTDVFFTFCICSVRHTAHTTTSNEDCEVRMIGERVDKNGVVFCVSLCVTLNVSSWKITENASHCQLRVATKWKNALGTSTK